ncbi:MAG TPA: hypothetical protein VED01_26045 [Burkholderiales bacterium]|nr:hypothetical protein [Burkholderiales bacterium]
MKQVVITRTCAGQWLYTIYIDGRVVVVGMSSTRTRAEEEARLA